MFIRPNVVLNEPDCGNNPTLKNEYGWNPYIKIPNSCSDKYFGQYFWKSISRVVNV